MKDSGIPWLKEIPDHWNVERGKNVLLLHKRPVRESDEVITCFRDGEVILRSERRTEGFTMSDKEIGYQGINKGDIVIHGMDGFAGAMGVSKSTGKGSPVLIVCSPKYDAIPEYVVYYLRSLAMTNVFVALATGIRERSCDLRWNKISELEFILPPSHEQQRIADFLDQKCNEIDEMVSLQEQIIEELKSYRKSIIAETVCRGTSLDVELKDSGISWIGKIPNNWRIIRTKNIFECSKEIVGEDWKGSQLLSLTTKGVKAISFGSTSGKVPDSYNTYQKVFKGRIIMCLFDLDCSAVFSGLSPINGMISPAYKVLTVLDGFCPQYYAYWFDYIFDGRKYKYLSKNIRYSLTYDEFAALGIVAPPYSEQQQIAKYLDQKCTEIDNLVAIKQQKIEELKEYKKSIIYEYITGKKEVI